MKKFFKFIFGTTAVAATGFAAYLAYKKFTGKDIIEDDDDFEDDLDDFEFDEETTAKAPEYVSINQPAAEGSAE